MADSTEESPTVEKLAEAAAEKAPAPSPEQARPKGIPGQLTHVEGVWYGPNARKLIDRFGKLFDPEIHQVEDDGTPRLSPNGRAQRRPGPPKKAKSSKDHPPSFGTGASVPPGGIPGQAPPPTPGSDAAVDAAYEKQYETLAAVTVAQYEAGFVALFGEKWKLRKVGKLDERDYQTEAWTNYYRARGIRDVPPELGIALAMGTYVLPRVNWGEARAMAREKMQAMGWIDAPADRRDHGDGKDDDGNAARPRARAQGGVFHRARPDRGPALAD